MDLISYAVAVAVAVLQDLPGHLAQWMAVMGPWIYILLFFIVFAETGLIVTPFLPGDSLLFAIGALTAIENGLSLPILLISLIAAAILGDAVNYTVGRWLGIRLFKNSDSKIFNPSHLQRTEAFYIRHGGKTIILARFLPVIRTYAPFVAGLSRMNYSRFAAYNVVGGVLWVMVFLLAGHYFGNLPRVKSNFQYVIGVIIILSILPALFEIWRGRRARTL